MLPGDAALDVDVVHAGGLASAAARCLAARALVRGASGLDERGCGREGGAGAGARRG